MPIRFLSARATGYTDGVFAQTTTHATLLARIRAGGDSDAWREFHDRYHELLRGFARRRGVQPNDCEDIVQEVLVALTKALPGFDYDPAKGKFRSYLKTAVIRAIFKKRCQKPGETPLEHIEEATRAAAEDDEVERIWEDEWRQYHMRIAMSTIAAEFNENDRAAFDAYVGQQRPAQEVADMLSLSVDQVYQAKSRILKRLSGLIEQQVQDEG